MGKYQEFPSVVEIVMQRVQGKHSASIEPTQNKKRKEWKLSRTLNLGTFVGGTSSVVNILLGLFLALAVPHLWE